MYILGRYLGQAATEDKTPFFNNYGRLTSNKLEETLTRGDSPHCKSTKCEILFRINMISLCMMDVKKITHAFTTW